jgi:hypothetical protein
VIGWPNRCKLAHAFLREYIYKKLKLAQLLGQLGILLTLLQPATTGSPPDAAPRLQSHCRFRKRGTIYISDSGMKWMRWCKATTRPSPSRAARHREAGHPVVAAVPGLRHVPDLWGRVSPVKFGVDLE